MIGKIINSFKKAEFSKKLAVIIISFWITCIIADILTYFLLDKNFNIILDYINTATLVVLTSYFGKAALENLKKIGIPTNTEEVEEENVEYVSEDVNKE